MSIGDVLKSLREEFPEVTVSKIRFLEAEGLIEPERTPSGYRKFYQQDLARLRYILRLQRDNFMPLKIIRRKLEQFEVDGAEAVSRPSRSQPDDRVAPAEPPLPPMSAEDDLVIAKIARDFGKYGIEPRHMRMYRHFADREAGLFQQAVVPHRGASNDSKRRAVQSLNDLAKLSKRLKQLLLRASLREHLQP